MLEISWFTLRLGKRNLEHFFNFSRAISTRFRTAHEKTIQHDAVGLTPSVRLQNSEHLRSCLGKPEGQMLEYHQGPNLAGSNQQSFHLAGKANTVSKNARTISSAYLLDSTLIAFWSYFWAMTISPGSKNMCVSCCFPHVHLQLQLGKFRRKKKKKRCHCQWHFKLRFFGLPTGWGLQGSLHLAAVEILPTSMRSGNGNS